MEKNFKALVVFKNGTTAVCSQSGFSKLVLQQIVFFKKSHRMFLFSNTNKTIDIKKLKMLYTTKD